MIKCYTKKHKINEQMRLYLTLACIAYPSLNLSPCLFMQFELVQSSYVWQWWSYWISDQTKKTDIYNGLFFLVFSIRKVGWFLITSWIDVSRLTTLEGQNVRRALVKHPTHKLRSRNDTLGKYWLLHKKIIKKKTFFFINLIKTILGRGD
jgi:hypothetical protein